MVLEIADIRVDPAKQAEFEAAITQAASTVAVQAKGMEGYTVHKCIETPGRYILQIRWTTLENHTVDFREGPLFAQWRALIGPFFAGPPHVEHFNLVTQSK